MAPIVLLGIGLSLALGLLVTTSPMWTVLGVAVAGGGVGLVRLLWARSLWQVACTALLVGYLLLSRGFAYTGVSLGGLKVYVGEIVLFLALTMIPHGGTLDRFVRTSAGRLLIPWLIVGAGLTVVGLRSYGMVVALRDSAACYYALYLYVGYAFARRREDARRLLGVVGAVLLLVLAYSVLFSLVDLRAVSPYAPGSDYPLLDFRDDVESAHVAGGVLFALLMGAHYGWPMWLRAAGSTLQLAMLVAMQVRATYLSFAVAVTGVTLVAGLRRVVRPLAIMTVVLLASLVPLDYLGVLEPWNVTPTRLVEEVLSIADVHVSGQYRYADSDISVQNNTWRLTFWKLMVQQNTVGISPFLFGQGFGAMLNDPAFIANQDRPNRNPHNFLVGLFYRMGSVGVALWIGLQATVYAGIVRGIRRARRRGEEWTADALTYIAGYTWVIAGTALLGVVLEAPFGAIPYYFLLGMGMRLTEPPVDARI